MILFWAKPCSSILISTDGSPIANKAVKAEASRFAREIGAKVTAYQAIGALLTHIDDEGYVIDPKMHEDFERAREVAQRRLDAIGKAARAGGRRVRFSGDPG